MYKVTEMWNHSVMGFSETWWNNSSSLASVAPQIQKLVYARMAMMYDDCYLVGVRISLVGGVRQSTVCLPGDNILPDGVTNLHLPYQGGVPSLNPKPVESQLRQVVQIYVSYGINQKTVRYLSSVPADVCLTEPFGSGVQGDVTFFDAYANWRKLLVNSNWGIMTRQLTGAGAPVPILGAEVGTQTAPLLGITVLAATAPPFAQGLKVAVQHARPPKGTRTSTLNGTWIVDSVGPGSQTGTTNVYLRGSEGVLPTSVRFTDKSTIALVQLGFTPISWIHSMRAGIHKRGRPSMAPRGRRLSRTTLDP